MSDKKNVVGTINWVDLTVENAEEIRDFYHKVVGWKVETFKMGEYDDYCMNQPVSNRNLAGICHKQGANADLPSQWLMYITVESLENSLHYCQDMGGKVLTDIRDVGNGRYAVIQDPAGAVAALFEPKR
jgi:uncharacterized protein